MVHLVVNLRITAGAKKQDKTVAPYRQLRESTPRPWCAFILLCRLWRDTNAVSTSITAVASTRRFFRALRVGGTTCSFRDRGTGSTISRWPLWFIEGASGALANRTPPMSDCWTVFTAVQWVPLRTHGVPVDDTAGSLSRAEYFFGVCLSGSRSWSVELIRSICSRCWLLQATIHPWRVVLLCTGMLSLDMTGSVCNTPHLSLSLQWHKVTQQGPAMWTRVSCGVPALHTLAAQAS